MSELSARSHAPIIALGVTGGIAAYKSVILVRLLRKAGFQVQILPTAAALEMVGKTTWEAISGNQVYSHITDSAHNVTHISLAQKADLLVIAPATANTIAKIRAGIADNLLLNTVLAAHAPVLIAPAMHSEMWQNPATVENISVLQERGFKIIGPESGQLTGKDSGVGRMSEPEDIFRQILQELSIDFPNAARESDKTLAGKKIVITGGGTHEPIDPVRFIGNRSTGMMSVALTKAFADFGAEVQLLGANISENILAPIAAEISLGKIHFQQVVTAQELQAAVTKLAQDADAIIMAAAVADYRVKELCETKIKSGSSTLRLELTPNPDILSSLVRTRTQRKPQIIVGFAAETGDCEKNFQEFGIEKAIRKGADLLAINRVGTNIGFGNIDTELFIVDQNGIEKAIIKGNKAVAAQQLAMLIRDEILEA